MNIAGAQFENITVEAAVKLLQDAIDEMIENGDI